MVLGLVLLDKIGECELRAAHGRLFGETIGASGQTGTGCGRPFSHARPRSKQCQPNGARMRPYAGEGNV